MHVLLLLLSIGTFCTTAFAQPATPASTSPTILVDALAFKGAIGEERARVDVYISVPYQSLQFEAYKQSLAGQYKVHIIIRDSGSRKFVDSSFTKSVVESDYAVTRGSTGKAENTVRSYVLPPGTYRIEVSISDVFSRREYEQSRPLTVPDLLNDIPNMSSIMYLKEIEQSGDRYRITPAVGDVIWNSESPLFAFTEIYVDSVPRTLGLSWRITASDAKVLATGLGPVLTCSLRTQQTFVSLNVPPRSSAGSYTLTLRLHPTTAGGVDTARTLATRTRPFTIPRTLSSSILSDLDKAVKQLIYVAEQSDLDLIRASQGDAERQQRFEEFWKRQDPTPSTTRNEAFEDYYGRIEAANKRFKSYTEGWLTDMGRVFIIYGEPISIDRYSSQTGSAMLIRWTFSNNMIFTFEDSTGFGDYRSRTPIPPGVRYKYRK